MIGDLPYANGKSGQRTTIFSADGLAPCEVSTQHKEPTRVVIPICGQETQSKDMHGWRFKENEEPMFTLTARDRHGVICNEENTQDSGCVHEQVQVDAGKDLRPKGSVSDSAYSDRGRISSDDNGR